MALNAYDIQVCIWKMLKLSSKTCLTISMQHPYASSSFFFSLILYICFPLLFRIMIYSLPLVVSTCFILTLRSNAKNDEGAKIENNNNDNSKNKPYNRVHSVRRRRAKEIKMEEIQHHVEEKTTISSTNFNSHTIAKNALIEESPKEIREIEVDFTAQQTENPNPIRKLGILKDDEDDETKSTNKTTMEVGSLDAERNKRLESLIARRRSRKLLNLQVRRSLLNMDNRNDQNHIPSLLLPKINTTTYSPNKMGGMFSPGPGSAPSVLIPMRNPFDLPYDPQEERPVLTGDSFSEEFSVGDKRGEMVYCRHKSFTLGPKLGDDFYEDGDETSSVRDFGFRRSATGFRFFRQGNESAGRQFSPIKEQEPNTNISEDDQIKEIIQVHENDVAQTDQEQSDLDESGQIPQSDFNYSSTSRSSSSSSSSSEDQPVCKIDREAILKSLSSMRRNALLEIENSDRIASLEVENNDRLGSVKTENNDRIGSLEIENNDRRGSVEIENNDRVESDSDQIGALEIENNDRIESDSDQIGALEIENTTGSDSNLSYANSALENAARLKQQYYANKPARSLYGVSYSIASDMQVEVSEVSSPPVTIDENMSYQDDQDVSWDDDRDMNNGGDSTEKHCIRSCSSTAVDSKSSEETGEASTVDSNDHQEQSLELNVGDVQSSMISPKSVLVPVLSQASFDPYVDHEEGHQSDALQNPTAVIEQTRSLPRSDGDGETSQSSGVSSKQDIEESSESAKASNLEIIENEYVNEKEKIQENDEQEEEETGNGSSEIARIHEATKEQSEETDTRSSTNIDEAFMKDLEATNSVDLCQSMDHSHNNENHHDDVNEDLIPSMPTKEEIFKHEEVVIGESEHHGTKTNSDEDQTESSALHQETSTSSSTFHGSKDEPVHQDFDADQTHVAVPELVRDSDNSENACKNDEDRKPEQHTNAKEATPETIDTLENETAVANQE